MPLTDEVGGIIISKHNQPYIMALSTNSISEISEALSHEFQAFLAEEYDFQVSEVLANAVVDFVDSTFGDADEDLKYDIAESLVARAYVSVPSF